MQRIATAALVAMLAGCAGTRLSSELSAYIGRDLQELKAHLGNPTGELESTGDRVYVWSADSVGVLPGAPGSSNAGLSGGTSYAGSTTATGLMPVKYECTVQVTVDAHNVIQHLQSEGSNVGCRRFRRALSR